MTEFYFVDQEEFRLIRRKYIDNLISSMIHLQTDPQITVWIDQLRWCRDQDRWDNEIRQLVHQAMNEYNNRWIFLQGGGIGETVAKYGSKIATGIAHGLQGTASAAAGKTAGIAAGITGTVRDWFLQSESKKETAGGTAALMEEIERLNALTNAYAQKK